MSQALALVLNASDTENQKANLVIENKAYTCLGTAWYLYLQTRTFFHCE